MKRVSLKARSGRGRKREEWVGVLHRDSRSEFDRLCRLRIPFNLNTLRSLAFDLLSNSQNTAYSMNMTNPRSGAPRFTRITRRFVQSFADRYRIVSREDTCKNN